MLKIVLIVNVTTASKLNSTVGAVKILLIYNILEKIILKFINSKHNPLVGKEELKIKVLITWVLNKDKIREPHFLNIKEADT